MKFEQFNPYIDRPKVKNWAGEVMSFCQVKYDGLRATVVVGKKSKIKVYGRKPGRDYTRYFSTAFLDVPPETVIDGEIIVRDMPASSVITALQEGWNWEFISFAMPFYNGEDLRWEPPTKNVERMKRLFLHTAKEIEWRRSRKGDVQDVDVVKDTARLLCVEGFVFKRLTYVDWYKVKPVKTVDAIVINWTEGTGKYKGKMGALGLGLYMREGEENIVSIGNVGTGFTDRQRGEYTKGYSIGSVCEVAYDSVAANGKLRFPSFVRFRDDKEPKECLISQIN
jgi:ATP-dependent DNA ligase